VSGGRSGSKVAARIVHACVESDRVPSLVEKISKVAAYRNLYCLFQLHHVSENKQVGPP
jgi:hypothetical protein